MNYHQKNASTVGKERRPLNERIKSIAKNALITTTLAATTFVAPIQTQSYYINSSTNPNSFALAQNQSTNTNDNFISYKEFPRVEKPEDLQAALTGKNAMPEKILNDIKKKIQLNIKIEGNSYTQKNISNGFFYVARDENAYFLNVIIVIKTKNKEQIPVNIGSVKLSKDLNQNVHEFYHVKIDPLEPKFQRPTKNNYVPIAIFESFSQSKDNKPAFTAGLIYLKINQTIDYPTKYIAYEEINKKNTTYYSEDLEQKIYRWDKKNDSEEISDVFLLKQGEMYITTQNVQQMNQIIGDIDQKYREYLTKINPSWDGWDVMLKLDGISKIKPIPELKRTYITTHKDATIYFLFCPYEITVEKPLIASTYLPDTEKKYIELKTNKLYLYIIYLGTEQDGFLNIYPCKYYRLNKDDKLIIDEYRNKDVFLLGFLIINQLGGSMHGGFLYDPFIYKSFDFSFESSPYIRPPSSSTLTINDRVVPRSEVQKNFYKKLLQYDKLEFLTYHQPEKTINGKRVEYSFYYVFTPIFLTPVQVKVNNSDIEDHTYLTVGILLISYKFDNDIKLAYTLQGFFGNVLSHERVFDALVKDVENEYLEKVLNWKD